MCILRIVDFPGGVDLNIADSIVRARYRNGFGKAELLKPGQPYEFTIEMYPTSLVFAARPPHPPRYFEQQFPALRCESRIPANRSTTTAAGRSPRIRSIWMRSIHRIFLPIIPGIRDRRTFFPSPRISLWPVRLNVHLSLICNSRSMTHRVNDVIHADPHAERRILLRIIGRIRPLPRIANIRIEGSRDHQAAFVVINASPARDITIELVPFRQMFPADNLIALV